MSVLSAMCPTRPRVPPLLQTSSLRIGRILLWSSIPPLIKHTWFLKSRGEVQNQNLQAQWLSYGVVRFRRKRSFSRTDEVLQIVKADLRVEISQSPLFFANVSFSCHEVFPNIALFARTFLSLTKTCICVLNRVVLRCNGSRFFAIAKKGLFLYISFYLTVEYIGIHTHMRSKHNNRRHEMDQALQSISD